MTLTYRGKKYVQLQGAGFDATKKAQLTYRGLSYTKWAQGFTSKPRRKRVFLCSSQNEDANGASKASEALVNMPSAIANAVQNKGYVQD